ncbi:hypothetical protein HaLaN_04760 [Haematococcus lacustris]|uniref:Uncharacterized protein n=1 Tax=Haematococcus lacustris TaxID=44745 RepID=A0A699YS12_HAELA|nr:hypothetical protein HaLaN_04760 [Haematococcus lacustris]
MAHWEFAGRRRSRYLADMHHAPAQPDLDAGLPLQLFKGQLEAHPWPEAGHRPRRWQLDARWPGTAVSAHASDAQGVPSPIHGGGGGLLSGSPRSNHASL